MKELTITPKMKKITIIAVLLFNILILASCGPSAEEKAAAEQAAVQTPTEPIKVYSTDKSTIYMQVFSTGTWRTHVTWVQDNDGNITCISTY